MANKATTHNPQRKMFFPHSTPEQLKVNMANSARETMELTKDATRNGELQACHASRIHELMHFRSHTVDTDGF